MIDDPSMRDAFVAFRDDDELAAILSDAAHGRGLPPAFALAMAIGLIDRLRSKIRVLEATLNGRYLGDEAAE